MTYLATEMLLYLLSAAVIGIVLGWMIWGAGRRQKIGAMRRDLMTMVESEKTAHRETKRQLDDAEAKRAEAVEVAKADANRSLAELRQTVDAERLSAREAQIELERVRAEKEEAIQEGRASGQEAVDQAMHAANAEKAAAAEALARETQSRAQIEELRLLIGAEKLAAESARAELQQMRTNMQAELETERSVHGQAKIALEDIRSTLARTLGAGALDFTAKSGDASAASSPGNGADQGDQGRSRPAAMSAGDPERSQPASFIARTDMAAAGDALNNPDLDEADIEDREDLRLDLSSTIQSEPEPGETAEDVDPPPLLPPPIPDRIQLSRPLPVEPARTGRPATFSDRRPDDVDDLKAIDGISPELERRLHDNGCYRYRQLADLAQRDIDWLARSIGVTASQIAADRWVEQAKGLRLADRAVTDDEPAIVDPVDRENAAG